MNKEKLVIQIINRFTRKVLLFVRNTDRKIVCKLIAKKTPIDDKKIIFSVFAGRSYACSPKAIYEYMIKQEEFKDYKFVWAFLNPNEKQILDDPRTEKVKMYSKNFYKHLGSAKYWILNFKTDKYLYKKKNQVFIQCWHGTPLKRLGCDIKIKEGNKGMSLREIHKLYIEDGKKYDYFISPSKFCTEKFATSFRLDRTNKKDIIVETGYPRNDFLYNYTQEDIDRVKEKLNLPKDKKIILYAPTFRDNQYRLGRGHSYTLEINLEKLKEKLADEYIILLRTHYLIEHKINVESLKGFVYDVSDYDDINEIYIISDMLVTDYSSVFFDYANLRRPIIYYMYDLDEYQNNIRDFYIDLKELPGPIVKTEEELLEKITKPDLWKEEYKEAYDALIKKYAYLEDGNASKRVVERCIKR